MNYQHSYHAGNFADVIKHAVLSLILDAFHQKESPFCFIDTHAGAGCYDITSEHAQKTQEAEEGILKLLQDPKPPELLSSYLKVVRAAQLNPHNPTITQYPGSPWVADQWCRREDVMVLNELHPESCRLLKRQFNARSNVYIHQREAYEFLPGVLPPKQKRGLILIDPPFEKPDEEHLLTQGLERALEKFPQGVYLLWFPLTSRNPIWKPVPKLYGILKSHKTLTVTLRFTSLRSEEIGLIGTSLVLINPPYLLEEKLKVLLPYFLKIWGETPSAGSFQLVKSGEN